MNSYSVRCIVEIPKEEFNSLAYLYEERITAWLATDIDQAIDKAITEVKDYCEANGYRFTGLSQAYWMTEQVSLDGVEVFSLLRESDLPSDEYLDAFFSTGNERQAEKPE